MREWSKLLSSGTRNRIWAVRDVLAELDVLTETIGRRVVRS